MRICVITPGALGSNPRVVKEATALQEAGYDVHVVCTKILSQLEFRDQDILASAAWRTERIDLSTPVRWPFERARQLGMRSAFAVSRLPAFAETALSAFTRRLVAHAVSLPADLYIAHYPAALPAAAIAARRYGSLYAFDAEDFHLGDWPDSAEHAAERRIVHAIEARYLPGCAYVTAASPGIADAYAETCGIPRPTVVLNVFPRSQAPPGPTPRGTAAPAPSVYWFSQTIGSDRGLECAVRAIGRAQSRPHLHLRGTPAAGFLDHLRKIAGEADAVDRLHVLPPAAPSEMERLAAAYDVGLSGEPGHTANNRIALGNKLFSYLLAGIPALISDTPAHRAFAAEAGGAARLYPVDDAVSLAAALDTLLGDPASLAAARNAAWRLGQERVNWDVEQAKLLSCVAAALEAGLARQRREVAPHAAGRDRNILGLLEHLRKLRASSAVVREMHQLLREPYYRALEMIYRRGAPARLPDGTSVRLHPRLLGMCPETYEPAVTALLAHHVHEGSTVVDVGAHVGLHTLMFSRRVGAAGRVVAVEPSPASVGLLRRHLNWNACKNVTVIEAAVGHREGVTEFSYRADPTDPGGFANSLAYDIRGLKRCVTMMTLDAICNNFSPDVIKIDVEGAELLVLRGAEELLARAAPTLVIAVHPEPMRAMGAGPADLIAFLKLRGFCGHHLDGRPATDPGFEEIVFRKSLVADSEDVPMFDSQAY